MNIALWIVQILLTVMFLMAGAMKFMQPKEKLAEQQDWVEGFSQSQIHLIGMAEVLGAVGLVLPMLLNILPVLTPVAAAGLMLVQLGAMLTHFRRQEYPMIVMNLVLFGMVLFVAYGRFVLVPVM